MTHVVSTLRLLLLLPLPPAAAAAPPYLLLLVASGDDAYRKIRAGASLVELYTAFAYNGPALIPVIKQQLAECLERDGFSSVSEAVGADHRLSRRSSSLKRRRSSSSS